MRSRNCREDLETIFRAGIERVDSYQLVSQAVHVLEGHLLIDTSETLRSIFLSEFEKVFVIGFGKATAGMALAVEEALGDWIADGVISVKYDHTAPLKRIRTIEAGHPIPDRNGLQAANAIGRLVDQADEKTLVITLISGGGSALLPAPLHASSSDGDFALKLEEKQEVTRILLGCGATIHEINTVRKHFSDLKGGRLAERIAPATCISLILSDVIGDDLDVIASGATSPDNSSYEDVKAVFEKYNILDQLPWTVRRILSLGLEDKIPDTPDRDHRAFVRTENTLLGTNTLALEACRLKAESLGYVTHIASSQLSGEAREVAANLFAAAKQHATQSKEKPACLLFGGETTVTMNGSGKGGRNQEMALAFLAELSDNPDYSGKIHFLSAGTDGTDGPTDAAGAFADTVLLKSANDRNLSIKAYLNDNDSYHFFETIEGLLKTGPTNTNVCDIQIILLSE